MSLAREDDIIIPGTTGIITALGREANQFSKSSELAQYIGTIHVVYQIITGRANGIALNQLVDPARISNDTTRKEQQVEIPKTTIEDKARAYESWFRD